LDSPSGTPTNLQISSLRGRLADPQKILKRLSSFSRGERFRSGAVFAPSAAAFAASGF
jgi:hypothetical protein